MTNLPTVITSAGLQPQAPASLRAQLLALVAATNPGYTANLPGSLIEDISSTDVGAIVLCDQARIELLNSLTPLGANEFLLGQLGALYGVIQGAASNTSVYVQFTGTPGYVVAQGFTISDGTYQYIVQDGGIIGSGGTSSLLYAVATIAGSWPVAQNTVQQLVTSVPSTVTLSVNNPQAGTPSTSAEGPTSYRARVLQAGLGISQGVPTYVKTKLTNVAGVQPRLVSMRLLATEGWEIICGGGDEYEVAYAIFQSVFDIDSLAGSTISVSGITNANPGVVTTNLNHGYTTGQVCQINGAQGMTSINGIDLTITVLSPTTFSVGINTSGYPAWTSGGVVTPNFRNVVVSVNDYPDTYMIPFVNPPLQDVAIDLAWNTNSTNYVSAAAIAQLGAPALASYVNSIVVGQPINVFEMQSVFQASVANILDPNLLTRMVFSVSINGIGVSPTSGTGIIAGDPESYFLTSVPQITIVQG